MLAGTIAGPVVLGIGSGSGAVLSPGTKSSLGTLTVQNKLTFNADATYDFALNSSRLASDRVLAKGSTIDSGARITLVDNGTSLLPAGTSFAIISNTSAGNPIRGTFVDLPDGSIITLARNTFRASYSGGDGNDLTLIVVP